MLWIFVLSHIAVIAYSFPLQLRILFPCLSLCCIELLHRLAEPSSRSKSAKWSSLKYRNRDQTRKNRQQEKRDVRPEGTLNHHVAVVTGDSVLQFLIPPPICCVNHLNSTWVVEKNPRFSFYAPPLQFRMGGMDDQNPCPKLLVY